MKPEAKRAFTNSLFDEFARIGKAVGSGRRLELIELLAQGERMVEELANETAQTVANTSQHLQVLRQAHLVETRRSGTHIAYRLADDRVARLWCALRDVGQARLAEVDRLVDTYLKDRGEKTFIDCQRSLDPRIER